MFHLALTIFISFKIVISGGYGYNNRRCDNGVAKAKFDEKNNGISGYATITDTGYFWLYLDISKFDKSICANNGGNDEFDYHIHEIWNNDDLNDQITDYCGPTYTAGHYNPYSFVN